MNAKSRLGLCMRILKIVQRNLSLFTLSSKCQYSINFDTISQDSLDVKSPLELECQVTRMRETISHMTFWREHADNCCISNPFRILDYNFIQYVFVYFLPLATAWRHSYYCLRHLTGAWDIKVARSTLECSVVRVTSSTIVSIQQ